MKRSNLIERFDFLGPEPKLKIFSKERYKTAIGGLLSIVSIAIMLILSVYFSVITFSRKQMSVIYNEVFDNNPVFNFTQYPMFFAVTESSGVSVAEKIIELQMQYWNYKNTASWIDLKVKKCEDSDFGVYAEILNTYKERKYCFDRQEMINKNISTLYGTYGDISSTFGWFNFFVKRCLNDPKVNRTHCADPKVVEQKTYYLNLVFGTIGFLIDNNNPVAGKPYFNSMAFSISSTINKQYWYKYRNVDHTTDTGLVFTDELMDQYYDFEPVTESVDQRASVLYPGLFAEASFTMSHTRRTFRRHYLKIQDLLASIGGVLKGILVIAQLLSNYFVSQVYLMDLFNSIVFVDKKDTKSAINKITNNNNNNNNEISRSVYNLQTIKMNVASNLLSLKNNDK
jgi:hypothetical protein